MESKKLHFAIALWVVTILVVGVLWYSKEKPLGAILRPSAAIQQGVFESKALLNASTTAGHAATSSPILIEGAKRITLMFARSTTSQNDISSGTTTFKVWVTSDNEASATTYTLFNGLIKMASSSITTSDLYDSRHNKVSLYDEQNATTTAYMDLRDGGYRMLMCVAKPQTGAANSEKMTCRANIEW